jgi:hypothetical protein
MPSKIRKPSSPTFSTKLVGFSSELKFPKAAQRYTRAQRQEVQAPGYWMPTVLIDKRGLVLANFAGVLKANRSVFGRKMIIIRESDLIQTEAGKFVRALTTLARKNKWGRDILDIELQYLRKLV